ncbi:hypothetical protein MCOR02_009931 [Pyricularia oryzae]|nr:hypothetical protein MCOR02_009931 [Pyricularia oryzae]
MDSAPIDPSLMDAGIVPQTQFDETPSQPDATNVLRQIIENPRKPNGVRKKVKRGNKLLQQLNNPMLQHAQRIEGMRQHAKLLFFINLQMRSGVEEIIDFNWNDMFDPKEPNDVKTGIYKYFANQLNNNGRTWKNDILTQMEDSNQ